MVWPSIVLLKKKGPAAVDLMYRLVDFTGIRIVEFTERDAKEASLVYGRYGKGRKHPANLNLSDCPAYMLAKREHARLLFVGDDFSQTDIEPALAT